ncbi:beta-lactamase/transpeptidase-like protein [Cucurbitaria berberidis CBS 394.84]|uniref:Beta-lactamase/transpeptidase-like protein n=1 Tax=Cucurbitaria berberidis CBS 394.84 TaxID=1168544 RepID=A0A9P4LC47_9PLEO|nr:beta-lactamase/transpeptidase-like protein [Cucurbitaria berberidis CBS 394.84]KAF1850311.1 beta-lactamase/transpeptidase-like protein [Cucurbitaria berberidis CBS 394.84]
MKTAAFVFLSGLLGIAQIPLVIASPNCPLIGAEFPPPQRLAEHPIWQRAIRNITAAFDYIDGSNITGIDRFSYSIQIFSTNPGAPILWDRHRTATDLPADTPGVSVVDGNTVYRLGSVSKVLAVLAWLAELGDVHWNQPVTKFLPELAVYAGRSTSNAFDGVRETAWDDVTIGSLASQVSGLERDCKTRDYSDGRRTFIMESRFSNAVYCTKAALWKFFRGLGSMFPSYPPWQTASYSNVGYQIFAYALESFTKKRFVDILNNRIIKPLGLEHTYYENAPASVGIIPGTIKETYWSAHLGDASPGGNMYSSPNDLSTIGRAILSSKLIKPALTRRWLNPVTFSADIAASISAPWGVRRIQLAKDTQPHRSLSIFTKAGTFRKYTSFLTLMRDYNLGFTIMMAGDPAMSNFMGADLLGAAVIPAYDAVARDEADKLFSGTYAARDGPITRSWLTITTDPNKPGLGIGPWISNGTDMVDMATKLQAGTDYTTINAEARLYYTQLESPMANGGKKQAWKAVYEDTGRPAAGPQLWSTDCAAWVSVTGITYGSLPLDEFVFFFDKSGKVVSVTNLALRSTLYKLES